MNSVLIEELNKYKDEDNNLVIMFADSKFKTKVDQFIESSPNNYLIFSMDDALHDYLKNKNAHSYYWPLKIGSDVRTRQTLWLKRSEMIANLIDHDINILHTDADAQFNKGKNPLELFKNYPYVDMITTMGTVWPPEIFQKWHFVVRCGFIYYRATAKTKKFMNYFIQNIKKFHDDQQAINRTIFEKEIKWNLGSNMYNLKFRNKDIQCCYDPIFGVLSKLENMNIILMPHRWFPRLSDKYNDPWIVDMILR